MKLSLIPLLTCFASLAVACGATTDAAPADGPAAPPAAPPTEEPAPKTPAAPTSCSAGLADPACAATTPAPTTSAAVSAFLKETAIPLRCDVGGEEAYWDLRPLVDLYGSQKMFMMGEVHGTNEIGILSSLLLEELAEKGLVNVVAFEMPMDVEPVFQRYIDNGKDATAEQLLKRMAPNFFGVILTKTARDLAEKGIKLRVGAVDIPQSPRLAVTAIQEIAEKLTAQKDAVLATLPASASEPPSASDIAAVNAYFDHVMSKKTEICAELSEADCDRLDAMTHALWASTLTYDREDSELWFARREVVIYYNLRAKMPAASDRMFLHMGAAHTNKHTFSAGSRMAKEYPLTKGQVFSIAPAYGDGSVIWYGQDMDLPGEPASVVAALSDAPEHPFFLSTTRPSKSCEENPLGKEADGSVTGEGTRAELYDGYVHYGKLTSERRPYDTEFSRDSDVLGGSLDAFRARVRERERQALASGVLSRARALSR